MRSNKNRESQNPSQNHNYGKYQYQHPQNGYIKQPSRINPIRLISDPSYQINDTRLRNALNDAGIHFIQYMNYQQCQKELKEERKIYSNQKNLVIFNNKNYGIPYKILNKINKNIVLCSYPQKQNSELIKFTPKSSDVIKQYERLNNLPAFNTLLKKKEYMKYQSDIKNQQKQQQKNLKNLQQTKLRRIQSNSQLKLSQGNQRQNIHLSNKNSQSQYRNSKSTDKKIRFKSIYKSPQKKLNIKFNQYYFYDFKNKTGQSFQKYKQMIKSISNVSIKFSPFTNIKDFKKYVENNNNKRFLIFAHVQNVYNIVKQIGQIKYKNSKDRNKSKKNIRKRTVFQYSSQQRQKQRQKYKTQQQRKKLIQKLKLQQNQIQEQAYHQYAVYFVIYGSLSNTQDKKYQNQNFNLNYILNLNKKSYTFNDFLYQKNILIISQNVEQILGFMKTVDLSITKSYKSFINYSKKSYQNNSDNRSNQSNIQYDRREKNMKTNDINKMNNNDYGFSNRPNSNLNQQQQIKRRSQQEIKPNNKIVNSLPTSLLNNQKNMIVSEGNLNKNTINNKKDDYNSNAYYVGINEGSIVQPNKPGNQLYVNSADKVQNQKNIMNNSNISNKYNQNQNHLKQQQINNSNYHNNYQGYLHMLPLKQQRISSNFTFGKNQSINQKNIDQIENMDDDVKKIDNTHQQINNSIKNNTEKHFEKQKTNVIIVNSKEDPYQIAINNTNENQIKNLNQNNNRNKKETNKKEPNSSISNSMIQVQNNKNQKEIQNKQISQKIINVNPNNISKIQNQQQKIINLNEKNQKKKVINILSTQKKNQKSQQQIINNNNLINSQNQNQIQKQKQRQNQMENNASILSSKQSSIISLSKVKKIINNILITKFNDDQRDFDDKVKNYSYLKQKNISQKKKLMKWRIDNQQVTSLDSNLKHNHDSYINRQNQQESISHNKNNFKNKMQQEKIIINNYKNQQINRKKKMQPQNPQQSILNEQQSKQNENNHQSSFDKQYKRYYQSHFYKGIYLNKKQVQDRKRNLWKYSRIQQHYIYSEPLYYQALQNKKNDQLKQNYLNSKEKLNRQRKTLQENFQKKNNLNTYVSRKSDNYSNQNRFLRRNEHQSNQQSPYYSSNYQHLQLKKQKQQQRIIASPTPKISYVYQYKKNKNYESGSSQNILQLQSRKQLQNNQNTRVYTQIRQSQLLSNKIYNIPWNPIYGSCHYLIKDPKYKGINFLQDQNLKTIQKQIRKKLTRYDRLDLYKTQQQFKDLIKQSYSSQYQKYDLGLIFNNRQAFEETLIRQQDKLKRYYIIFIDYIQRQIKFSNDKVIHIPYPFSEKKLDEVKEFIKKRKGINQDKNINDDNYKKFYQMGNIKYNNPYGYNLNQNQQYKSTVTYVSRNRYNSDASNHSNNSNIKSNRSSKIKPYKIRNSSQERQEKNSFRSQSSVNSYGKNQESPRNKLKNSRQIRNKSRIGNSPQKTRLFFHQNQDYLQNAVQIKYPNQYAIKLYKKIQQVYKMLKDQNSYTKNILFLHPDLKNQKINFNLFNKVYVVGSRIGLPKGITSISSEDELLDVIRNI